jgi:TolA-binding protein
MKYIDDMVYLINVYQSYQEMFGFWRTTVLSIMAAYGFMSFLIVMWSILLYMFQNNNSSEDNASEHIAEKKNNGSRSQNCQHKLKIDELEKTIEKLSQKVEYLEECTLNFDREIIDKSKITDTSIDDLNEEVTAINKEISEKFQKIQRNFNLISLRLGNFTDEEYRKFSSSVNQRLREMKGAIFLPDDENDDDSDNDAQC